MAETLYVFSQFNYKKIFLPHPDSIQKIIAAVIMIMINRRLLNPENF